MRNQIAHGYGSSPHARGTQAPDQVQEVRQRFIPACAGNAGARPSPGGTAAVHPRMRGERVGGEVAVLGPAGSSPHARGTPDLRENDPMTHRFIPACAGNATLPPLRWQGMTVHPRMRGERRGVDAMTLSSIRFIPACAGNAVSASPQPQWKPVHPRMRGERLRVQADSGESGGSSPHARGTRVHPVRYQRRRRFIPACAGNARSFQPIRRKNSVHPRMRGERTSNKLLIYRRKSEPSDSTEHSGC